MKQTNKDFYPIDPPPPFSLELNQVAESVKRWECNALFDYRFQ